MDTAPSRHGVAALSGGIAKRHAHAQNLTVYLSLRWSCIALQTAHSQQSCPNSDVTVG